MTPPPQPAARREAGRSRDDGVNPTGRLDAVAGESPVDATVPFWITACVRLQPPRRRNGSAVDSAADKVLTAVQVLIADRVKTSDDVAVVLDRTKVARWCGYDSSKKAVWIFDYLVSIGFLMIEQHYVRGHKGRSPDTFFVFTQAPSGYVGPRTYAELDQALAAPAGPRLLFGATPTNPRSTSRGPGGNQDPDLGAHLGTKTDKPAVQRLGAQVGTKTGDLGTQVGTKTTEPAGQGLDAQVGPFLQIDRRSSISEGEIEERSTERFVPEDEPPAAAATGVDEASVRDLVRRLPWARWATARGMTWRLNQADADLVHAAICAAIAEAGISLEQATEIALAALAEAKTNPVGYVTDAFGKYLRRRLRSLRYEPLADDPLPLTPVNGRDADTERVLPACSTCGAREGDRRHDRVIDGPPRRICPVCHPDAEPGDDADGYQPIAPIVGITSVNKLASPVLARRAREQAGPEAVAAAAENPSITEDELAVVIAQAQPHLVGGQCKFRAAQLLLTWQSSVDKPDSVQAVETV